MKTAIVNSDERPARGVPRRPCALAMMVKTPRAGAVKTRLVPPLTHAEAALLSRCFVRDTAESIAGVAGQHSANGVALYTPIGTEAALGELLPAAFALLPQRGGSLSERLINAAEELLVRRGYASLCLIGSDSPTLPPSVLALAIEALGRRGDRVVLGPSADGGYYLIGLKRAHRHLFTEIEWSTAKVFSQTLERAAELDLEVEQLPTWYDVDTAAELKKLRAELSAPSDDEGAPLAPYRAPHTRACLAELFESGKGGARIHFGRGGIA